MIENENDLNRFIEAQERSYFNALSEIRNGKKQTHWMWYVFPQIRGLGTSDVSVKFGIADLKEAEAYLAHPILGSRLIEISKAVLKFTENQLTTFSEARMILNCNRA